MSIVAAFQPVLPSTDRGRLRAALAAVGRRLASSPLESSVLQTVAAPVGGALGAAPSGGRLRMRASWHTVAAPDGTTRLEATWHPGH
ncbi:hypothetical protein [Kitasatospora sp. SUK 42]|uniref:hypothetical protein n=1 Tax=Kitasatospora sp. SUK 42 TaxID=1588882 RepID=UPI001C31B4A4|nr:hypothetical protein [Kitasatospora sp. SUK 42]MBV2156537.1 hypothetical protein [Kitasatospora sp. SUK 42]